MGIRNSLGVKETRIATGFALAMTMTYVVILREQRDRRIYFNEILHFVQNDISSPCHSEGAQRPWESVIPLA